MVVFDFHNCCCPDQLHAFLWRPVLYSASGMIIMWNNGPRFASNWMRNKTFSINRLAIADRFLLTAPHHSGTGVRQAASEREIGEPPIKILLNWFAPEFIPRNTFFRLNCWDSQRYLSSSGLHWLAGWLTTAWPAIFGLLYVQFNWPEIGCLHDLSPDWRLSVLWLPRSTNMCPPVYTFTVN